MVIGGGVEVRLFACSREPFLFHGFRWLRLHLRRRLVGLGCHNLRLCQAFLTSPQHEELHARLARNIPQTYSPKLVTFFTKQTQNTTRNIPLKRTPKRAPETYRGDKHMFALASHRDTHTHPCIVVPPTSPEHPWKSSPQCNSITHRDEPIRSCQVLECTTGYALIETARCRGKTCAKCATADAQLMKLKSACPIPICIPTFLRPVIVLTSGLPKYSDDSHI